MEESITTIILIASILLLGLISSIISRKLKIPNLLLLILLGMGLSHISVNHQPLIDFPPLFLTSIAVITLALVVFDSSSKFKFKKFDSLTISGLKISMLFLAINLVCMSFLAFYIFNLDSIFLALIFAAVISGTDPSATLMILAGAKTKLFELLKIEAILNTPLIVLIPFLLVDIIEKVGGRFTVDILSEQSLPFLQQFVTGIGTGILIALIFFRFMKKYYSATLSPLAMITAALLTYTLSETLGGNGVLGVTTAGLVFGNLYHVKHMKTLLKFGEIFSEVLEILVFVLIGTVITLPLSFSFLFPATILFIVYLFIRLLSVEIAFRKEYSFKEKLYMTLNTPKGIAVAVVVFTLATKSISGLDLILDMILLFMIYSIVISTVVTHFTKFFTKTEIKVSEKE
ncbi:hypothetical protein GF336_00930 [Candidatus Woesearchaeota archaeon]|nr:hypothetical protein [Candidatus Woesearchaeota archaeon]